MTRKVRRLTSALAKVSGRMSAGLNLQLSNLPSRTLGSTWLAHTWSTKYNAATTSVSCCRFLFTRTTIEPEPYEIEVGIPSTDPEQDSRTCDPAATEKNDATEKGLEPVSPETTRVRTRAV